MRNIFIYKGFDEKKLLIGLINASKEECYSSIFTSNSNEKKQIFPKEYINYDIIAGIGSVSSMSSNKNSFNNLRKYSKSQNDWLFGYLSYDIKNELENLSSNNLDNFNSNNLHFFCPKYVLLLKNRHLEIHTHETKEKCDNFLLILSLKN